MQSIPPVEVNLPRAGGWGVGESRPRSASDLGERPTAGVGMIDKRVPLVMNGEPLAPRGP